MNGTLPVTAPGGGGRRFYKMTGSGNDFVFFDARGAWEAVLEEPALIRRLCARGTGVGADGVVVLGPASAPPGPGGAIRVGLRYFNADGSRASLCGNATLCTTWLAAALAEGGGGPVAAARRGTVADAEVTIETDAGVLRGRVVGGVAEFELPVVRVVRPSCPDLAVEGAEVRLGYAVAGVPHLVLLVPDVAGADVRGRGAALRRAAALQPEGANVNFVARDASGGWRMRTYERGVEGETLACGTGAVAAAVLLTLWGEARGTVALATRSGGVLTVRLGVRDGGWWPVLRGEGRLVYAGELAW